MIEIIKFWAQIPVADFLLLLICISAFACRDPKRLKKITLSKRR